MIMLNKEPLDPPKVPIKKQNKIFYYYALYYGYFETKKINNKKG
jgi:hypothetical protein